MVHAIIRHNILSDKKIYLISSPTDPVNLKKYQDTRALQCITYTVVARVP
jgi:hypothetical protein